MFVFPILIPKCQADLCLVNTINFVLLVFNDNLFSFNHSSILTSLELTFLFNSFGQEFVSVRTVSSANNFVLKLDTRGMSLMYNKNSNGPRVEPCGTPQVT